MKRNGACRVHSDLGYLTLSQLKASSLWQSLTTCTPEPEELGETYLSRACRAWADFRTLQIILLCSWPGARCQSQWLLTFILESLSWLWEQRRRNLLTAEMLSWKGKLKQENCLDFLNSLFLNTKVQNKLVSLPLVCLVWKNHILSHDYSGASGIFLVKRWDGRVQNVSLKCSSPFSWVTALTSPVYQRDYGLTLNTLIPR